MMKRLILLTSLLLLPALACNFGVTPAPTDAPAASPPAAPAPNPTPDTAALAGEPRFGIDYVFPLVSYYQQEIWPATLAETGAEWVNFAQVSWETLEPAAPRGNAHRYEWSGLDQSVRLWQKHGFRIVMSLRLGDGWFAGPIKYRIELPILGEVAIKNSDRLPADEHMDSYRAWIAALVERYDNDGQSDMPGLRYPILYYQVGNEYSNPAFWSGTMQDYRTLLEETRRAAQSASPQVKIVSNGIRWNDLFHNDPSAELFEARFAAFLETLPSDTWRESWQRARAITEGTVALAGVYDILDAGGNGPYETASAGYMAWVQKELAKSGLTTTIWDMEARSEPRLFFNSTVEFHPELAVPDGDEVLRLLKTPADARHDRAVAWYRAEQSRILVRVFVTRFAAGFEKVFMGMASDWDQTLGALSTPNPYLGLLDADGNPWPAFYAMKLLAEKIDGFAYAEKMPSEPGVELYRFTFADGRPAAWVAWLAESETRGMNDPLPTRQATLQGLTGEVTVYTIPTVGSDYQTSQMTGSPQGLLITLSAEPIIIQEE